MNAIGKLGVRVSGALARRAREQGVDYRVHGLEYTAVGIDWKKIVFVLYVRSKNEGRDKLRAFVKEQVRSCPKQKLALLGFSQGAHVVGDVLSKKVGGLTKDELASVRAVALVADPRFNSREPFATGKDLQGGRNGILGARSPGDLESVAGRIRSWCRAKDLVCQGLPNPLGGIHNEQGYHEAYGEAIVDFLAGKLGWRETRNERQVVSRTANSVTSRRGQITVTYSWTGSTPHNIALLGRRLLVKRSGKNVYDANAATARCAKRDPCESSLREAPSITHLDEDAEYEIVVAQWEAGTVCCVTWIVLDWTGRGYWRTDFVAFNSPGPTLVDPDRDGRMQVRGYVDEFKYAYACGACSVLPLVVYDFDPSRRGLVDTTCRYPGLVETEARSFVSRLQAYIRRVRGGAPPDDSGWTRSIAAAWTADEVRLRRGQAAFRKLESWSRDGVFEMDKLDTTVLGTPSQFIAKLRRDLPKFGVRACAR